MWKIAKVGYSSITNTFGHDRFGLLLLILKLLKKWGLFLGDILERSGLVLHFLHLHPVFMWLISILKTFVLFNPPTFVFLDY